MTRTGSSAGAVSATVNLTDGTATAPGDYTNTLITVNFANGDTAPKTVTIPIVNDTLVEGNETLNLSLGSPTGATIGTQNTATLNIVDDDVALAQIVNLTGSGIVADSITDFRSASAIDSNVDILSNFITNSFNGVAIANRSVTVDGTKNWWDSPTGPMVGGTDPNRIAGVGASLIAFNPFATSVL